MNILKYTSSVLLTALLICCLAGQVDAQWSHDATVNNAVCTATNSQAAPKVWSDGSGGTIIAWDDWRNGESDIYAQRINASGVVQWAVDGIPICTATNDQTSPQLCSDGAGGAIIAWTDYRSGSQHLYAQRINASGVVQWAVNGKPICLLLYDGWSSLCSDGAGGAIITWADNGGTGLIRAQRINASGVLQWTVNGVAISTSRNAIATPLPICGDGAGGAIITWFDLHGELGCDIYAQRINASGVVQWTATGVAICTTTAGALYHQLCSDGEGGAISTWMDHRGGTFDIYAQRINASGVVQWAVNGIPICTTTDAQEYPQLCSDGAGGAIITWGDARDYWGIYAQRITASGIVQWQVNGIPICTATSVQWEPQLSSDGAGGAIITWWDWRSGTSDIYAQQVNASGVAQWTVNGIPISTATGDQRMPQLCSDGAGGAIIAWEDWRAVANCDIYAQKIDRFGHFSSFTKMYLRDNGGETDSLEYGTAAGATDGIDAAFGEYELPPLPPTGVFDVRWRITGMQGAKLDIRDTLGGTRTQVTYRGLMQPGSGGYPFTLRWNRMGLPSGTFTLRDELGGSSFVLDMKHQDSLVITNPDIVSFRIIYDRRSTQKLFIRDISGRSDSLEYGTAEGATDNIDWLFGEWELPPLPPTGVFDVRWKITGTQGTKLDVRDTLGGTRTQATYRGLIQPSDPPGGYPFTLKWNRSELPSGTFTLRDAPGGTRFAVDMKQQDSVVITDSDIASFQIIFDRRPAFYCTFQQGWNIMSLPLTVDDRRKNWLFTGSNSNAFAYLPSGYVVRDTLQNGIGYWLKFPSAQDIGIAGTLRMRDTVAVAVGWNMIGAISDSVNVTTIQQIPPSIIASQIYGYNAGYSVTTMLLPSRGYWVKTIASGLLILSSASGLNKGSLSPSYALDRAATITISDSRVATQTLCFTSELMEKKDLDFFELPPPPPAGTFNARFSTNRVLEAVKEGESKMIPIQISDAQYPLTIRWEMKDQSLTASIVIGTTEVPMSGNGSITVSDSKAPISLKLGGYSSLPKEFALFQNYPNPFNPSTTIKYDLPKDSRVSLKLFNILGQEVATLVNEEQKAGYRSVQWNANNVASGVYFYRIQAGDFVASKKLLLLK